MLVRIVLPLLLLLLPLSLPAQSPAVPAPPTGNASSYILIDYHSGRVLAEKNPQEQVEPASLTKMMTTYVAGEELKAGHISLDDKVRISEKAWRMKGSRMFVEVDTQVSVEALLKGIVIQSGNDASVALAEHISGSEDVFAQLMNQTAAKLGMEDTHFENSTGMPASSHITTAHDMAILASALIRDHPELYGLHAVKEYTYNDISQPNRNQLLWRDSSVDGIKTGHTEAAGYCLVASAKREDMRLISVVMGAESSKSRTSFSQSLLEYGFRFYDTRQIAEAGHKLGTAHVWKGASDSLSYGIKEDLYVTVARSEADKLEETIDIGEPLVAPVEQGQAIGSISVMSGGKVLVKQPWIAHDAVGLGGIFHRLMDSFWLMLE